MQFLVVAYDGSDEEAPGRRMRAREAHLARVAEKMAAGQVRYAAALLDDDERMIGSVLVVDVPSRADVDAWLEDEPYVVGDVWQDITVTPCRVPPQLEPPTG